VKEVLSMAFSLVFLLGIGLVVLIGILLLAAFLRK